MAAKQAIMTPAGHTTMACLFYLLFDICRVICCAKDLPQLKRHN